MSVFARCSALLLVCIAVMVAAYPDGAPSSTCGGMVPSGHHHTTTSGPSPFVLKVSSTSYSPGDVITGNLSSPTGERLRGFLIEVGTASTPSEKEKGIGTFTDLEDTTKHVCGFSGITHRNKDEKDIVKFSWKSPDTSQGDLYVRATVVQEFKPSKYWLGTFSQRITPQ